MRSGYLVLWDEINPDGSKARHNKRTQPGIAVWATSEDEALDRVREIVGRLPDGAKVVAVHPEPRPTWALREDESDGSEETADAA